MVLWNHQILGVVCDATVDNQNNLHQQFCPSDGFLVRFCQMRRKRRLSIRFGFSPDWGVDSALWMRVGLEVVPCWHSLCRRPREGMAGSYGLEIGWVRWKQVLKGKQKDLLFTPFLVGQHFWATCHVFVSVLSMEIAGWTMKSVCPSGVCRWRSTQTQTPTPRASCDKCFLWRCREEGSYQSFLWTLNWIQEAVHTFDILSQKCKGGWIPGQSLTQFNTLIYLRKERYGYITGHGEKVLSSTPIYDNS